MRPRYLLPLQLALLVSVLLSGCDSPTGPRDPAALNFGRVVTGHVAAADSQVYHIDVKAGQSFAVYAQSPGVVRVQLRDPAARMAGGVTPTAGDTASRRDGVTATAAADGRYTVVVSSRSGTADVEFTLRPELLDHVPEHARQTFTLGSIVTGERIDAGFDEDEFIIDVPTGTEAELYVHADELPVVPWLALNVSLGRVGVPSPFYQSGFNPPVGESDFQQLATGQLTLAAGKYALRVSGTYGIAYSFQLKPINRAPEVAPATLAAGDTISESIDYVGDIDEYSLRGTPGAEYEVFAAATGAAPHQVQVTFPDADQSGPISTYTVLDLPLLDAATGRVVMPASGQLTVRVSDALDRDGLYRGPYRLAAVAIDRRPEGQGEIIVPSGAVISGAFEIYGDVDEYRFVLDQPTRLTIRCAPTPPAGCNAIGAAVYSDAAPSSPVTLDSEPLPAGSYRLHVESRPGFGGPPSARGMYRGPYQLVLATKDSTPEDVPAALVVGSPVTESLTWPWDDDVFTFDVATTDTLLMHLAMADGLSGRYRVDLRDAVTGAGVALTGQYGELPTESRMILAAGHYSVTVSWGSAPWMPARKGSYGFELQRVSAAPEGRSAEIAVGDTVDGRFDVSGDIDDYVLHGTPGELFSLHLYNVSSFSTITWSSVTVRDSATGAILAKPWRTTAPLITPVLTMPPDGVLQFRVCPAPDCANYNGIWPYRFSIDHVDPAPESRAAQFAFGDTVADAIERPSDIDDFTFDATAGQSIDVVVLQAPGLFSGPDGLVLFVLDETSGEQLARLQLDSWAVEKGTNVLRDVALAHTGRYRIRVQGDPTFTALDATGAYRFTVLAK